MKGTFIALLAGAFAAVGCTSKKVSETEGTPPRGPVRITQLYASPPNPPQGERSLVCYSTENADRVRLDPPDQPVWPSPNHCFEVKPSRKVTYVLTVEGGGKQATRSVTVTPGPPAPEILNVNVDSREAPRGTPMTVCYKARNAASVAVTPGVWIGEHTAESGCVRHVLEETTLFRVRARNAAGEIVDGEDVEVQVK
jgi:hypothetical protein